MKAMDNGKTPEQKEVGRYELKDSDYKAALSMSTPSLIQIDKSEISKFDKDFVDFDSDDDDDDSTEKKPI